MEDVSMTMTHLYGPITHILQVERDVQHAVCATPASVVMEWNVARIPKLGVLRLEATEDLLPLA